MPLIPRSKLSDEAVRRIAQGFVCGEPVAEIAEATGVSSKSCRNTVLQLRSLLLRPAFNAWRPVDPYLVLYDHRPDLLRDAKARLFGAMAGCYTNRRCVSNYAQGRRRDRLCRKCPLRCLLGATTEETEANIPAYAAFGDTVRALYAYLGIGRETGATPAEIAQLRYVHAVVLLTADARTRQTSDNRPDFAHRGRLTVRALYETVAGMIGIARERK